jgi:hypothetical protein
MKAIGDDRSAHALAAAIARVDGSESEIVGIEAFPPSLPFYLRRTITLATRDGSELTSNYVTRHIDSVRRLRGTTLREVGWWREALTTCDRARIFVVRTDAGARSQLAERLPLIAETRKYAAYGPCGTALLASEPHTVAAGREPPARSETR